jgi:hypothetical protein
MINQDFIEHIERTIWTVECELATLRDMLTQIRAEQDALAFYLTAATYEEAA